MSDAADPWVEELARDLGEAQRRRLLACLGGQRREVPEVSGAATSKLAAEAGPDIALWLAERFGGTAVDFPSPHGVAVERNASRLRAAILDAELDEPARSRNGMATECGVTVAWVQRLRKQMRAERDGENA